jgi:hypothetical protein
MRGPKAPPGVDDQIDDLLARAKAKQAELKNAVAAAQAVPATPAAKPAAPAAKPGAPAGDAGTGVMRDAPF